MCEIKKRQNEPISSSRPLDTTEGENPLRGRKRTHFAVTECTRGRYRTILGSLLAMLLRRPARSTPELQLTTHAAQPDR